MMIWILLKKDIRAFQMSARFVMFVIALDLTYIEAQRKIVLAVHRTNKLENPFGFI